MSWKKLTVEDIRLILAEEEIQKLNTLSLENELIDKVIDETLNVVSATWRGAMASKGYNIDVRDFYVPYEYIYYILVHARHLIWTRFPNSPTIALDERRVEEYDNAMKMLEKMTIAPSSPYDASDPDNPNKNPEEIVNGSIVNYPKRFPAWFEESIFVDNLVELTHRKEKEF